MTADTDPQTDAYFREAQGWASDQRASEQRSRRTAWGVAGAATVVAVCEAIALVTLMPLKTVEPYTLLVDRQTGYVEALRSLERQTITADAALTRSFLVQYVIARESFDLPGVATNYRKVALWSGPAERTAYTSTMQATNPASPFMTLPRSAQVSVTIKSVSSLGSARSLVRFRTTRTDAGGQGLPPRDWAAVLTYRYSGAAMTAEDRLLNPLGFEVTRYRRDAEALPEAVVPVATVPQAPAAVVVVPPSGQPRILRRAARPADPAQP